MKITTNARARGVGNKSAGPTQASEPCMYTSRARATTSCRCEARRSRHDASAIKPTQQDPFGEADVEHH